VISSYLALHLFAIEQGGWLYLLLHYSSDISETYATCWAANGLKYLQTREKTAQKRQVRIKRLGVARQLYPVAVSIYYQCWIQSFIELDGWDSCRMNCR
jgi:hypothetical protein